MFSFPSVMRLARDRAPQRNDSGCNIRRVDGIFRVVKDRNKGNWLEKKISENVLVENSVS